jgi:hypothetical protein
VVFGGEAGGFRVNFRIKPLNRQERTVQATIFEVFADADRLRAEGNFGLAGWAAPAISLVASDLRREGLRQAGRRGLPAERCCAVRCSNNASSVTRNWPLSGGFGVLSRLCPPAAGLVAKSVLHRTISAIRPETWKRSAGC